VGQGRYLTTGFLVFAATSDTQVNGIETAGPDADDKLRGEFTTPQRLALNTSAVLTSSALPESRLFRTPLLVPAAESAFLNKESDVLVTGLLADELTISAPTLSLADWNGPAEFQFVGRTHLQLTGPVRFTDLRNVNYLRFFSPFVTLPTASVVVDFSGPTGGTFYIDVDQTLNLTNTSVTTHGGGLILQSHSGDLKISGGTLTADAAIGAPLVVAGAMNLDAPLGAVILTGVRVDAPGGTVAVQGLTATLQQSVFNLGGNLVLGTDGALSLDTLTFTAPAGAVFQATGNDVITARTLDFGAFAEVNMGARTLVLESVHFRGGTVVRLVSENGLLAPNPNTGATAVTGFVNFIRDVTYDNKPAQDFVATTVGGTGAQPTAIQISKPN
jgi:hypothetical protein